MRKTFKKYINKFKKGNTNFSIYKPNEQKLTVLFFLF